MLNARSEIPAKQPSGTLETGQDARSLMSAPTLRCIFGQSGQSKAQKFHQEAAAPSRAISTVQQTSSAGKTITAQLQSCTGSEVTDRRARSWSANSSSVPSCQKNPKVCEMPRAFQLNAPRVHPANGTNSQWRTGTEVTRTKAPHDLPAPESVALTVTQSLKQRYWSCTCRH